MIKSKKQMFIVIGVFTIVMLLGTVTYAFFNYTRTGASNIIKVGRISFVSKDEETITLSNLFPIDPENTTDMNDTTKVGTYQINIEGDTDYSGGIEYLVSTANSNLSNLPISINMTVGSGLGTNDINYFTSRDAATTPIYKKIVGSEIVGDQMLLVGFIPQNTTLGTSNETGDTITIKAYLDKNKILISDTYDGTESDNMGTPNSLAQGKTVLTTTEWNALSTNGVSFKIKVEANEGIWVEEVLSRNDMANFNTMNQELISTSIKSTITEINFIKISEEMIDTHANLIDLTADGGQGVVKAWVDGTKLYIASPGETYFPDDSTGLFRGYSNVTRINFNNINTSNVTNMFAMFVSCNGLTNIDLSGFDTSNVTNMSGMFVSCNGLTNIDLSGFDTSNVTDMSGMFNGCGSLTSIDLSGFDTSSVADMRLMFKDCSGLMSLDLSGLDTSNVTSMNEMFRGCSKLEKLNLSGLGGDRLENIGQIFDDCTNLKEINMSDFNFGSSLLYPGGFFSDSSVEIFNLSGANFGYGTTLRGLFTGMSNLKVIDLSNVILNDSITDVSGLFYNDSKLQTIYVSNTWNINNITTSSEMFYGCTSLVGGAGTTFVSSNPTDKTYARIDGGTSNPGYLTLKTN